MKMVYLFAMDKIVFVSIVVFLKELNEKGISFWMQERIEDGPLGGLQEFPGGKIESGEQPVEAAVREVQEEVGIEVEVESLKLFKIQHYNFNNKNIILHVYLNFDLCFDNGHEKKLLMEKGQWHRLDYKNKSHELKGKIPKINHVFIDEILDHFSEVEHQNQEHISRQL